MQSDFSTDFQSSRKKLFTPHAPKEPATHFSYDKSLIALVSSWGGLICDLNIQIGSFVTEIITTNNAPTIAVNQDWVQVIGQSNIGSFTIYIPSDAAAFILQLANANLDITKLEGGDAALIFEHVFTQSLNSLEALIGSDLSIISITDVEAPVTGELLGFEFDIEGKTQQGALQIKGELHHQVESIIAHHSFPEEKNLDNDLIVHLGPVVVSARQAYLARIGEMIDCGVEPSSVIKGVLMRSDGRYWPIHIEDEQIEISGELAGPVQLSNETTDTIFVTFGLGKASLSAYQRHILGTGSKINIQRLPNNSANIYYQARPFGQGVLSILGNNLAVTLNSVGAFKV